MDRISAHALSPGKRPQDPRGGPEGPGEGKRRGFSIFGPECSPGGSPMAENGTGRNIVTGCAVRVTGMKATAPGKRISV